MWGGGGKMEREGMMGKGVGLVGTTGRRGRDGSGC